MSSNITISFFNLICYYNSYFFQSQGIENSSHSIFSLLTSLLLNFLLLKYQNQDKTPFETHPKSIYCAITNFLAYSILHDIEKRFSPQRRRSCTYVVVHDYTMLLMGSLRVASLGSILLPDSACPVLYLLCLMLPSCGLLHLAYKNIKVIFWPLFFSLWRFMAHFHHLRDQLDIPL